MPFTDKRHFGLILQVVVALVLNELPTMQGNVDETHQLRDVHLSTIPGLAVVTYGRHTNTVFVTHVTGDLKFRCQDQSGMSKPQSL